MDHTVSIGQLDRPEQEAYDLVDHVNFVKHCDMLGRGFSIDDPVSCYHPRYGWSNGVVADICEGSEFPYLVEWYGSDDDSLSGMYWLKKDRLRHLTMTA